MNEVWNRLPPVWIPLLIILTGALLMALSSSASATVHVVTTTSDLRALAQEVGGASVAVQSIARGTQDPHYIEPKPSYMLKLNHADLLISVGLDLETAWLTSLQQGARNPKILRGQKGFLEVGPALDPIDVISGKVSRAQGDVHPLGNPHVHLDPDRAAQIAEMIASRLSELDPERASTYRKNAQALKERLARKSLEWQARLKKTGHTQVVTYHKTLSYFLKRFAISNPVVLEPKPGIPPTTSHIMKVIEEMKRSKISLILVENYFDPAVTKKIKQEIPEVRTEIVAVAVEGAPGLLKIDDLFEHIVKAIEGKP